MYAKLESVLKYIKLIKQVLNEITYSLVSFFILLVFSVSFFALLINEIDSDTYLKVLDNYVRLVLTSWPAAFLIIALILAFSQKDSISHFIKNRMTRVGLDGVSGDVLTTAASEGEMQEKGVRDVRDESEISSTVGTNNIHADAPLVQVEDRVEKALPNTISLNFHEKYKERVRVEEIVQTSLIAHFGDRYKTRVKLSNQKGQSLILDGIIYSSSEQIHAVEIKYNPSTQMSPGFPYIVRKLKDKLANFGISKLILILVYKDLTVEQATEFVKSANVSASLYFYNLTSSEELVPVLVPPKNKKLF